MSEVASMRVEIAFRADVLKQRGCSLERAKRIVQRIFEQVGLYCTANRDGLTAHDRGTQMTLSVFGGWLCRCCVPTVSRTAPRNACSMMRTGWWRISLDRREK